MIHRLERCGTGPAGGPFMLRTMQGSIGEYG
jgi:hypothetical protein